jgi:hypothetical protein
MTESDSGFRGPSCEIRRAPMTEADRSIVAGQASPQSVFVNLGCLAGVALGVGLPVACGLGQLLGPRWTVASYGAGALASLLLFVCLVPSLWKIVQAERASIKTDLQRGEVEILDVWAGRVTELHGDHSSIDPALCFDLGDKRLLLLIGQWIWDAARYQSSEGQVAPRIEGDWDEFFNRMPAPWSFPTAQFRLKRLPESGLVLSLTPTGPYIKPEDSGIGIVAKEARRYRESQLLGGTIESISQALMTIPKDKP